MIKETFKQAIQNVWSNKVRTFLTMLGIIIGVMAVIVIVGLGNGMTHMMQDFYSDMGSDILSVNVMTASTRTVEVSDVYNIINQKPEYYRGLSPIASAGTDPLRVAGEKYRRTNISGVNEDYLTINNYKVAKGRGIQYADLMDNKNICVIGDYVWFDENRDGVQDPGEPGVPGVRVILQSRQGLLLVFLQFQLGTVQGLAPLGGEIVLNFLEVGMLAQEYPQLVLDGLRLLLHLPHRPAVHIPTQVDHAVLLEQVVVKFVLGDQLGVVRGFVIDLDGHLPPAVFN